MCGGGEGREGGQDGWITDMDWTGCHPKFYFVELSVCRTSCFVVPSTPRSNGDAAALSCV